MEEKSFEQSMRELEAAVSALESGNVPLEDMIALYEKGMALYKDCTAQLDAFEARMEKAAASEEDKA